jgi:hypothetical protein
VIRTIFPVGVFPSVALSGGLGMMAVREGDPRQPGALVVYQWGGTGIDRAEEIFRLGLPAGSPCFPNLYVYDGLLWVAYHDGRRQWLRNLSGGAVQDFDGLSNPSAFGGGYFAYTEPGQPYLVHRINLQTGENVQRRNGAPTGLSRILADGSIVTIDEDRFSFAGATIPAYAGDLIVGEGPNGGTVWSLGVRGVLWPGLDGFTPKCAADNGRFAICTAGSGSVRLFCGSRADLIATIAAPAPVPVPVPVPQPKPEPVSMRLPDSVQQIVNTLYARNYGLAHGTDDERRSLTKLIVEQTVFALPGQGWGWKSADPTRPPSKDGIAKQQDGRLLGFDLFNGGTRAPNDHPASEDITGQYFIAVAGVDHLGGSVPVPAPQTPPPASSPDPALLARIASLEEENRRLEADNLKLHAHLTYDDMMQTVAACDAAYEGAQHGRKKIAMLPSLTAHLVYRMAFEGFTPEALIEDARERGAFL